MNNYHYHFQNEFIFLLFNAFFNLFYNLNIFTKYYLFDFLCCFKTCPLSRNATLNLDLNGLNLKVNFINILFIKEFHFRIIRVISQLLMIYIMN